MAKRSIDRRVARTRTMLQNALIALMLEKGYEAITVEDICAAADVGRSTFYAHYASKEDLHRSGMEELRRQLADRQKDAAAKQDGARGLRFSLPIFEHARDHIDHYRAMVGRRGDAGALGHLRRLVADMVRGELAAGSAKCSIDGVPRELVVQYLVGAYMAVLTWWLASGAKLSPQRVDAIFGQLVAAGFGIVA